MLEEQKNLDSRKRWISVIPVSLRGLLTVVVFVWGLEVLDLLPILNLDAFGVRPRCISGLIGIPLMPFLHGDFSHLLSNTLPFLVLGGIVLRAEKRNFVLATVVITLLGGLGTWLIGRSNSIHIGASGLIYGYFGYVMIRAFMERNLIWIMTGLAVGFFYGSMILGILPSHNQQISWEGHLCGMATGIWLGWKRSKKIKFLKESEAKPSSTLSDL